MFNEVILKKKLILSTENVKNMLHNIVFKDFYSNFALPAMTYALKW